MATASSVKPLVPATIIRHHSYYRQVAGMG